MFNCRGWSPSTLSVPLSARCIAPTSTAAEASAVEFRAGVPWKSWVPVICGAVADACCGMVPAPASGAAATTCTDVPYGLPVRPGRVGSPADLQNWHRHGQVQGSATLLHFKNSSDQYFSYRVASKQTNASFSFPRSRHFIAAHSEFILIPSQKYPKPLELSLHTCAYIPGTYKSDLQPYQIFHRNLRPYVYRPLPALHRYPLQYH